MLAGEAALPDVEAALARYPEAAVEAVVPVAESRAAGALAALRLLRRHLQLEGEEEASLIGFALLRDTDAADDLFDALVNGRSPVPLYAAKALHLLRHDPSIVGRFERIIAEIEPNRDLRRAFEIG